MVLILDAGSTVITRLRGAPVQVGIAVFPRVPVRAVTCVIFHVVVASSAIHARVRITHVDTVLAVGSGETAHRKTNIN